MDIYSTEKHQCWLSQIVQLSLAEHFEWSLGMDWWQ